MVDLVRAAILVVLLCKLTLRADAEPPVAEALKRTALSQIVLADPHVVLDEPDDAITGVACSHAGEFVAAVTLKGKVWLYDFVKTQKAIEISNTSRESVGNRVAVSADGKIFATNCSGKGVTIWETGLQKSLRVIPLESVGVLSFSPDGRLIAVGNNANDSVAVCEVGSGKVTTELRGHDHRVAGLCFSPNGKLLASGSFDKTIRLWEVPAGKEIGRFQSDDFRNLGVTSVVFSPDGNLLASTGVSPSLILSDCAIRLWDVQKKLELTAIQGGLAMRSISFSPDGKFIASIEFGRKVRMWRIEDRTEVASFDMKLGDGDPNMEFVAFSNAGSLVIGGVESGANGSYGAMLVLLRVSETVE